MNVPHPVRTLAFAGFVLATLLACAGCGSSDSGTPPPAPAAGTAKPDLTQDEK